MPSQTKICKNCSSPIDMNANFCGVCGSKYESNATPISNNIGVVAELEQIADIKSETTYNPYKAENKKPMGMGQLLFSIKGRISRKSFYKGSFLSLFSWGTLAVLIWIFGSILTNIFSDKNSGTGFFEIVMGFGLFVCLIGFYWSFLCLTVKRYHDLGLSYKRVFFLNLNPFNALSNALNFFFKAGNGPNKYGDYSQ